MSIVGSAHTMSTATSPAQNQDIGVDNSNVIMINTNNGDDGESLLDNRSVSSLSYFFRQQQQEIQAPATLGATSTFEDAGNTEQEVQTSRQSQYNESNPEEPGPQQQTRFSFYNADDFVVTVKPNSPSKSPKFDKNQNSLFQNSRKAVNSHDKSLDEFESDMQQDPLEKSNTKRRYNFYDAHEVKFTQTVLTTVAAQELQNSDVGNSVEDLLRLGGAASNLGSSVVSISDIPTDTTESTNLDSIEILKSLQEHEQQRLEILGSGTGHANKSRAHPRRSSLTSATKDASKAHTVGINKVVSSPVRTKSDHEKMPESNNNADNHIESSNPYEDAIKEALQLLRRHKKGSASNSVGSSVSKEHRKHSSERGSFDDSHQMVVHTNQLRQQLSPSGLSNSQPDDGSTFSFANSLNLRVNTHLEPDGHYDEDTIEHTNQTPSSDVGILGDVYQAEIEARRRQRQERMAKYANRLAELKQQGHISPTASASNTPTIALNSIASRSNHSQTLLSNSMKSPTISIDTADMQSWYEDDVNSVSGNHNTRYNRNTSSSAPALQEDCVIAVRSPPENPDLPMSGESYYGDQHIEDANYATNQRHYCNVSDASQNSSSYVSQEHDIQTGVERVLLAILERANSSSSSRGRGGVSSRDGSILASSQQHTTFFQEDVQSRTIYMNLEEKKSSNPTEDSSFIETELCDRTKGNGSFEAKSCQFLEAEKDPVIQQISSCTSEQDALLRALTDLLGPSSFTVPPSQLQFPHHSSNINGDNNFDVLNERATDRKFDTAVNEQFAASEDAVATMNETNPHLPARDPGTDNLRSQGIDHGSNIITGTVEDDSKPSIPGTQDEDQINLLSRDIDEVNVPKGFDTSLEAHLELDRMVEQVFISNNHDVDSVASSTEIGLQTESKLNVDRYQVSQSNDEETDREYIPFGTSSNSFTRSSESNYKGVADESFTDTEARTRILSRTTDGYSDDADDDKSSHVEEDSLLVDDDDEASYINTSEEDGVNDDDQQNIKDSVVRPVKNYNGLLGPLNKRSGGTTGVVLEDSSSSSSSESDSSSSNSSSEISGTDDDDEDDDDDSERQVSSKINSGGNSVASPSLFESLSAAVSLVTGVTSYEDPKLLPSVPSAPTAASLKADKGYFGNSVVKKDSDTESDDDDGIIESDDSTDSEAFELMLALCAHLLPVGVDSIASARQTSTKRLLEPLPDWDNSNIDEPGYRIVRLNSFQLRRVQRAFDKMVDYMKNLSQRNLLKKSNLSKNESDETAFERDLREAEDLLDADEKRARKSNSLTPIDDGISSSDLKRPSEDRINKPALLPSRDKDEDDSIDNDDKESTEIERSLSNFHGVKPVGRGEMGELEFFSLPIIFKSHVTGFEPTKDLILEAGNVVAGQYLVEGALGSAAFSTAYKCVNLNADAGDDHERHVCLKVIKNTKDFFDQSLDEIKILELLRQTGKCHEYNLIEMKTFFYHREHLIIVAELLRQNLFEFGKFIIDSGEEPYFTITRLSYITRQCLVGLNFVHNLGLVHSDVKPENILLASYSRALVKVIDFGSSCWLTDRQSSYIQSRSYRAPEVVLGLPYDGRIDVWSLGCVVAEMYTGEVTFQNDSIVSMLSRIEAICGPFPRHMIANGRQSHRYFSKCGLLYERVSLEGDGAKGEESYSEDDINYSDDNDEGTKLRYIDVFQPKRTTLCSRLGFEDTIMSVVAPPEFGIEFRQHDLARLFIDLVGQMLTIDPDIRPTAAELLQHPLMKFAATLTEEDVKYPSSTK